MVELAQWQMRFAELGVEVAAMAYDDVHVLQGFHVEHDLNYPLLRDVEGTHARAYGVLNTEYEPGHRAYGIPHPGILYVSPEGVVVAKLALPGYRRRPPFDEVYETVARLSQPSGDSADSQSSGNAGGR